jgi:hypothetical protein
MRPVVATLVPAVGDGAVVGAVVGATLGAVVGAWLATGAVVALEPLQAAAPNANEAMSRPPATRRARCRVIVGWAPRGA